MAKPCRLELNNSGSWKLLRLLDAAAWEYVAKHADEFQPGGDSEFYDHQEAR